MRCGAKPRSELDAMRASNRKYDSHPCLARLLLYADWYTRTCTNMPPSSGPSLPSRTVAAWRELVAGGGDPQPWLVQCRSAARASGDLNLWISLASDAQWQEQVTQLAARLAEPLPRAELVQRYPLLGVPFAVKDNIDVAGVPTTAACPAFAYEPAAQRQRGAAPARRRRTMAGQDQPGSVCHRPGGHALALWPAGQRLRRHAHQRRLQLGLGGGRGARPGRLFARHRYGRLGPRAGRLQRPGRLQAHTRARQHGRCGAGLPQHRLRVAVRAHGGRCRAAARADRRRRCARPLQPLRRRPGALAAPSRIGVPKSPAFFGDAGYAPMFAAAVERARGLGQQVVELDFAPLFEVAALLYEGPWVAERHSVVRELLAAQPEAFDPACARSLAVRRASAPPTPSRRSTSCAACSVSCARCGSRWTC